MEALRIQMAAQFDPMLAVATSDLDPLPHQIQAVYGDLLTATTAAMTPTDIQAGRRRSRPAPGDAGTGTNPPGIAELRQQSPGVHLIDPSPRLRVHRTVSHVQFLRSAIPQRQRLDLPRQPLQHEPGLRDLSARIGTTR